MEYYHFVTDIRAILFFEYSVQFGSTLIEYSSMY